MVLNNLFVQFLRMSSIMLLLFEPGRLKQLLGIFPTTQERSP
jgi:hypothetical protein